MGWLATPERTVKPSRSWIVFPLIGLVALAATEFGRFVCRPYVQSHGIDDFGITDSVGNLSGIVVTRFLGCTAMNPTKSQSLRLAVFCSFGFVLYEFLQPILPKGVCVAPRSIQLRHRYLWLHGCGTRDRLHCRGCVHTVPLLLGSPCKIARGETIYETAGGANVPRMSGLCGVSNHDLRTSPYSVEASYYRAGC